MDGWKVAKQSALYCSLLLRYNAEPALHEMSVENVICQNPQRHTQCVTKLHHVVYHEQNYKIKTKCTVRNVRL